MKKIATLIAIIIVAVVQQFFPKGEQSNSNQTESLENMNYSDDSQLIKDAQVLVKGTVTRVLSDDNEGSRHQRFILELPSGRTVLIAHNIDVAPRVQDIRTNDTVIVYGEFESNPQGGVIHWTHRDARGSHIHGWIKHRGKTYE